MAGFINGRCAILSDLSASFSPVNRLGKGREVVQRFLKVIRGVKVVCPQLLNPITTRFLCRHLCRSSLDVLYQLDLEALQEI